MTDFYHSKYTFSVLEFDIYQVSSRAGIYFRQSADSLVAVEFAVLFLVRFPCERGDLLSSPCLKMFSNDWFLSFRDED
jgi:hypothetical protein